MAGCAEQCVDLGQQLAQRERLDQVVVRARVEADHPNIDRVPRGEHEDGRIVPATAPWQAPSPSSIGMSTSRMIRSTGERATARSASAPLAAVATS